MKTINAIVKVLTALATVAGAVYIVATYGDKIVAWAKEIWQKMPTAPDADFVAEEPAAEAPAEEPAAEEAAAPAEEEAAPAEGAAEEPAVEAPAEAPAEVAEESAPVVADEADFEG